MLDPKTKYTYQDYLELPDDERYELIDGELYRMTPAPSTGHQRAVSKLGFKLMDYAESNQLGVVLLAPYDVVLSDTSVVQPDVIFVSSERRELITEANLQGAPDIAVEVISPGSVRRDREDKASLYARHGVQEYWIVDPEAETIEIRRLTDDGYGSADVHESGVVSTALIPGLEISLDEIFVQY